MKEAAFLRALDTLAPQIRDAYLGYIAGVVGAVSVAEVERAIYTGNDQLVLEAIGLGSLTAVLESIRTAFMAGGNAEMALVPVRGLAEAIGESRLVVVRTYVQFDVRRVSSERWLGENAAALLNDITEGQRDAIREVMAGAVQRGDSARNTALDIVGRVSKQTGNREGGIIGLSGAETVYVENARDELKSGDKAKLRNYLKRKRRDRRFDTVVERSIETGNPLTKEQIDRIVGRYSDRLLKTRGDMLGDTEAVQAYNAGRNQAWNQVLEDAGLSASDIETTWLTRGDEKVRGSHRPMAGQRRPLNEPFRSGSGASLRFPGDQSLGAGWGDTARCRCRLRYSLLKR